MFKNASILVFLLFLSGLFSCNTKNGIDDLDWLSGKWATEEVNQSRFYEEWSKVNDSLLRGMGYALKNGDTVFAEKLEIEARKDGIYYIAITKQEKENTVRFKLSETGKDEVLFENPLHDFPQKIRYKKASGDSILVTLKGEVEKQKKMKEVKLSKVH